MTENAAATAPIDVPRLRAALCRARQITGGDTLLYAVWCGLEATARGRDGAGTWAWLLGACGAMLLVSAVTMTVSFNKTDDAKAAGPTDAFVSHCRSVLTPVAGARGLSTPVLVSLCGLGAALFLVVAVSEVFAETPARYLHAASYALLAFAFFGRPLWNRFRRAPAMARELATLPPLPPPSADLVGRTRELLAQDQKIQAIKQWRTETGASLRDAKNAVENLERPTP